MENNEFYRLVSFSQTQIKVDLTGGILSASSNLTFDYFIKGLYYLHTIAVVYDLGAGAAHNRWFFEAGRALTIDNAFATGAYPNAYSGFCQINGIGAETFITQPNYGITNIQGSTVKTPSVLFPLNQALHFKPVIEYSGQSGGMNVSSVIEWNPDLLRSTTPDLHFDVQYLLGIVFINK